MDQIEVKLPSVPCVGPMRRWERHYDFESEPSLLASLLTIGTSDRWFDYRSIRIGYYQAGFEQFRARRFRHIGFHMKGLDDRDYDLVFGHYDIPTHTAYLWACGPNFGSSPNLNIMVR